MNTEPRLVEKIFNHRGLKFLLFLGSYILTVLLFSIPFGIIYTFVPMLFSFPGGFAWLFKYTESGYENWRITGISIYLIVTGCAVVLKNSRIAKVLYIIFVILLILNIIGCFQGLPSSY